MFKTLACIAALFAVATPAPARRVEAPTVVIVVRHAEKAAAEGGDPPLSEAGRKRAERLADIAEQAGVQFVYTTQFKRARDTARPLVERLKIPAQVVELGRDNSAGHPAALAGEIRTKHKGKTVLVVGHSNTAPRVAAALSGQSLPDLDDATEFDALFVVIIPDSGPARLIKAKY
ncbi:MAG: histidine phosphatase family protein [Acidobacteriota bacterium]|nr:histidine phosphatase family protein [Acidobacteriota bacterium]